MTVSDGRGRTVREGGLARWLAAIAPRFARGELAIALVSDARVRQLNRQYRHTDRPTDVLSFGGAHGYLGDIVIATSAARRQARDAGHSYAAELRVLALHGLLHLLGYDHDDKADRGRMARLEGRLRRKGGLGAGLIEREQGSSPASSDGAAERSEAARLKGRRAKRVRERGWGPASTNK